MSRDDLGIGDLVRYGEGATFKLKQRGIGVISGAYADGYFIVEEPGIFFGYKGLTLLSKAKK